MLPEILLEYSGRSVDFDWSLEMGRTWGRWRGWDGLLVALVLVTRPKMRFSTWVFPFDFNRD